MLSKPEHLKLIAETARELGKERVMVVHGCDGLDDITLSGESSVVELNNGKISEYTFRPNHLESILSTILMRLLVETIRVILNWQLSC